MDPTDHDHLHALLDGPLHAFSVWPLEVVPHVAAGLYSVWKGEDFLYIGMSGRGLSAAAIEARRQAVVAGKLEPFSGRLVDNTGTERLARGTLDDGAIASMNWLAAGVVGSLPGQ